MHNTENLLAKSFKSKLVKNVFYYYTAPYLITIWLQNSRCLHHYTSHKSWRHLDRTFLLKFSSIFLGALAKRFSWSNWFYSSSTSVPPILFARHSFAFNSPLLYGGKFSRQRKWRFNLNSLFGAGMAQLWAGEYGSNRCRTKPQWIIIKVLKTIKTQ